MIRGGYRHGVDWIARNDEPLETDQDAVECQITVLLLADLHFKDPEDVARDVLRRRKKIADQGDEPATRRT